MQTLDFFKQFAIPNRKYSCIFLNFRQAKRFDNKSLTVSKADWLVRRAGKQGVAVLQPLM